MVILFLLYKTFAVQRGPPYLAPLAGDDGRKGVLAKDAKKSVNKKQ